MSESSCNCITKTGKMCDKCKKRFVKEGGEMDGKLEFEFIFDENNNIVNFRAVHLVDNFFPRLPVNYQYIHIGLGCYIEQDNPELECEVFID